MTEPRNPITWAEMGEGEPSHEIGRKIEESMAAAAGDSKRLEIEGRTQPLGGGKDTQAFCKTFDPASQPPTPVDVILDVICSEFRSGVGDDFAGRIRINFRQKGNTRNVYTSFSRNVMPMEDEDDDETFDFDDEAAQHAPPGQIPPIPMGPSYGAQSGWQTPQGFPAVDMQGSGRIGPSAYERRRMTVKEAGLNEPLAEFLMAPQWGSMLDMMGGHNDRQVRANLDLVGVLQKSFDRVIDMNENLMMRMLENNAPAQMSPEHQQNQTNALMGVGMKLMKMWKKQEGNRGQGPAPTPAWGGTPSSSNDRAGDRAGDWNQAALHIPEADAGEWADDDQDDFEDFGTGTRPRPRPLDGGGGAAVELPGAAQTYLPTEQLASQVKHLAKQDPTAMKKMVLDMKSELATAMDIDPDMLDAFLDDDE